MRVLRYFTASPVDALCAFRTTSCFYIPAARRSSFRLKIDFKPHRNKPPLIIDAFELLKAVTTWPGEITHVLAECTRLALMATQFIIRPKFHSGILCVLRV